MNLLESLGISANESACYLRLVENGECSAIQMAEMTGLGRTNVYHLLERLKDRGVVEKIGEGRKTKFRARHPEALGTLLDAEEQRLRTTRRMLEFELPRLAMNFALGDNKSGVYRFEGKAGLERVYDELIRDRVRIDSVLNRALLWGLLAEHNAQFIKAQVKHRIKNRAICVDHEDSSKVDASEYREVRYLPPEKLPLSVDFRITTKKVVITSLTEDNVVGIILNDPEIVRNFGFLFEYMWGIAGEHS